ncbi:hypothetical protein LMG10661_01596 [Ralstonia syzygii subsp. syzygii]|nr:hypothetical protein LMG10661_01596 [Ralstonia syzygii subsp. syzygii]
MCNAFLICPQNAIPTPQNAIPVCWNVIPKVLERHPGVKLECHPDTPAVAVSAGVS